MQLLYVSNGPIFSVLLEKIGEKRECLDAFGASCLRIQVGPGFQVSFHSVVTLRASWYALPDTGHQICGQLRLDVCCQWKVRKKFVGA